LEAAGTGAKLITALQFRQLNVSKSGLPGSDLLADIATPQTGQCRMDRGREPIPLSGSRQP
jgi:hypothetical protein